MRRALAIVILASIGALTGCVASFRAYLGLYDQGTLGLTVGCLVAFSVALRLGVK